MIDWGRVAYLKHVYYDIPSGAALDDQFGWATPNAAKLLENQWVRHESVWGRLAVFIDGEDVTAYLDVPVVINHLQKSEPYSDRMAEVTLSALTGFAPLGGISWYGVGKGLVIRRMHPSVTLDPSEETTADADICFVGVVEQTYSRAGHRGVSAIGALYQTNWYVRAPSINDIEIDIGALLAFNLSDTTRPAYRFSNMVENLITLTSRDRGAWDEGLITYFDRLLAQTVQADGGQHTILISRPDTPVLVEKDLTTVHHHLWYGAPGVTEDLSVDMNGWWNVAYAEGVDRSGNAWRNGYPSTAGDGIVFQPLVYDPDVHPYDEEADGTLSEHFARIDAAKLRKEIFVNFGTGISLERAREILQNEYNRIHGEDLLLLPEHGTITLEGVGTEEAPPWGIKEGENVALRYYQGTGFGGKLFHIVDIDVSPGEAGLTRTVLTVDTAGRDADVMRALIEREVSAANPTKSLLVGRESSLKKDATVAWDANQSGYFPETRWVAGGAQSVSIPVASFDEWLFWRIRASEKDNIIRTVFQIGTDATYHLSIVDREPDPIAWPSDPFADGAWADDKPPGQLMGWGYGGATGLAAGYHPLTEAEGVPTGLLVSENVWPISHDDDESGPYPYVWVMLWVRSTPAPTLVAGAITAWGRLFRGRSS